MKLCSICHKNAAVVFTQRKVGNHNIMDGVCLSCACKTGIGGFSQILENFGINESNVDALTENLNQWAKDSEGKDPAELMNQALQQLSSMENQEGFQDFLRDMANQAEQGKKEAENGNPEEENIVEGLPLSELFKNVQGFFMTDENSLRNLLPVARGGDTEEKEGEATKKGNRIKLKFLDQFGTNLTQKAREGRLDPLIGRERELERVIQILNRRSKNNPVLLGEPGVGKTALAEGLASRIAQGEVPAKLRHMEVYLLDMTGMVAGTQFRGQFESRMKGVVDEARNHGNIILVIDELHNIMGAGDAEGSMNAANILKPALAKGEIRVLGSTTFNEYRRFIEKDTALERRFQQVILEEPGEVETLEILRGLRPCFEEHHHVRYSDAVLGATVRFAKRYLNERYFPDKAIDLLDEAGSRANLGQKILVDLEEAKQDLQNLQKTEEEADAKIAQAKEEDLNQLYEEKAKTTSLLLKKEEEVQRLEAQAQPVDITEENIAEVIEYWTQIPVRAITREETENLLDLEAKLHQRVIGQQEAVEAVAKAVRRSRAGFTKRHKPASFIFVGPTGVGKTELVKALAEALFHDEKALIRMDMSEFMESHTVSKLIGSPPGYVGYDDGGQLTEKIRRHPYSVVLFDEIEKAHPDVFNILLQLLDEGRLTDSHGKSVSFENTAIIMTSNAGTSKRAATIGFGQQNEENMASHVHSVLKDLFRPEFLNRVDEIIVFQHLKKEELRQIVDLMLKEVRDSLALYGLQLEVDNPAKDFLVREGYSQQYGARPLRKTIRKYLEDPLTDAYLRGRLEGKTKVRVTVDEQKPELRLEIESSMNKI